MHKQKKTMYFSENCDRISISKLNIEFINKVHMFNETEKEIHDTALEQYEQNMISSASNWSLEQSEQYQLLEQQEKELAVTEWSKALTERAKTKVFRDK